MKVLEALQATKQPTLLGRFAPGDHRREVGVKGGQSQLGQGRGEPSQTWLSDPVQPSLLPHPCQPGCPRPTYVRLFWPCSLHRLHDMLSTPHTLHLPVSLSFYSVFEPGTNRTVGAALQPALTSPPTISSHPPVPPPVSDPGPKL